MKTAIVYCRTSTTGQKESETIKAQVERNKALIQRHGVKVLKYGPRGDGWLIDDGVSGSLLEGREMGKLVDDLERGRVKPDYLIVFSLSRISRLDKSSRDMGKLVQSATDAARIKAVLLGGRVQVIDEEGINDPATVLFDIKTTLSTEQYRLIRSSTMAGKARRLGEGKFAKGGKPPYGYVQVAINGVDRKAGWTLAPHPEDSKHLVQILRWYVEAGPTEAARRATKDSIPTPMATTTGRKNKADDWSPTRWSPVSVQHIARNVRVYLGEQTLVFDGQPHQLQYPALIDHKLYAAVEQRKKTKTLKRRATVLTTGFVMCKCGEPLHAHNSHDKHHMRCGNQCGSMPEAQFSAHLWSMVECRLVQIRQHERKGASVDNYSIAIKTAKSKVSEVQDKISKLLDVYMDGSLDKETWQKKNEALTAQKAQLQGEVHRLEAERDTQAKKRAGENGVEARVTAVLRELRATRGEIPLDVRRKVLGDILQGEKVSVSWSKGHAVIKLSAFGGLAPVAVRTDRDPWTEMVGEAKGLVHLRHGVDDDISADVGLSRR
jgi:DNA invertase Pin-like site-specific DNA recombinase